MVCGAHKFRGCDQPDSQDTGRIVQMFDNLVGCKAITSNFEFSEMGNEAMEFSLHGRQTINLIESLIPAQNQRWRRA